jgi:hypothetical protein
MRKLLMGALLLCSLAVSAQEDGCSSLNKDIVVSSTSDYKYWDSKDAYTKEQAEELASEILEQHGICYEITDPPGMFILDTYHLDDDSSLHKRRTFIQR